MIEVDGELLGHSPLEFKILNRCVRVVVTKEFLEEVK
jgi:diacylglycerol kinase family enzyme